MNDKKLEIVKRVWELYREFGIRSVTMDDVVREMGISKKTLYQYFSDKTELVVAVMDSVYEKRKNEMCEVLLGKENAIEEMLTYYGLQLKMTREHKPTLIYDLKKYYPKIHEKVSVRKRQHIYDSVLQNLKRGKSEGLFRADINEEILARLNLMRIEAIMSSGIFSDEEIVAPYFFKEIWSYHMYGIVNNKGRKILEQNIDKLNK